jgi:hypothetical protein
MDCEVVACEKTEWDYVVSIRRPGDSIVRVLVPREDVASYPSQCVELSQHPFGLNLVCDDHYT